MWNFADPGREEGLVARGASVTAIVLIIALEVLVRYFEVSLAVFTIFAEDCIISFVLELTLALARFLSLPQLSLYWGLQSSTELL